jgi:hypothetical protein
VPAFPAGDAVHGGLRRGDLVEDDLRAAEQFGAGAGEGHPAGGAGKQRRAQLTLEAPDQFTERRCGEVQPAGGPPEMQFGGDGHERFELTQLHKVKVPAPAFIFSSTAPRVPGTEIAGGTLIVRPGRTVRS